MENYHMTLVAAAVFIACSAQAQVGMGGPANAAAGKYYAKVVIPARFDSTSERVVSLARFQTYRSGARVLQNHL